MVFVTVGTFAHFSKRSVKQMGVIRVRKDLLGTSSLIDLFCVTWQSQ